MMTKTDDGRTRIVAVDPSNLAEGGDPLACTVMDGIMDRIEIRGARQWEGGSFGDVEMQIANVYHRVGADALIIEANSMGRRMAYALKHEQHIPRVVPITTTGGTTRQGKMPGKRQLEVAAAELKSMDKMEHVNWLIKHQNVGLVLWPPDNTDSDPHMIELKRQWSIFGEYHAGRLEAPPGEHDDLMMSVVVGTYWLRHKVLRLGARTIEHVFGPAYAPLKQSLLRAPGADDDSDIINHYKQGI